MRKQESGHAKRVKKRKLQEFIKSQEGALDKFLFPTKQLESSTTKNVIEGLENENATEDANKELGNANANKDANEELRNENANEGIGNENANEELENENVDEGFSDINYDPGTWKKIDQRLRDLLVEKGPIRVLRDRDSDFPKDTTTNRHFASTHYVRHLSNGDRQDRRWLVYSNVSNKVFCFCCKLFKPDKMSTLLAEDGVDDWHNLSTKLKLHETNNEHLMNMSDWTELETRLKQNTTIDKVFEIKSTKREITGSKY